MTDTAKAKAAETAEAAEAAPAETEQTAPAETTETFAEMADRLFNQPAPSYNDPVIITAEMRQEMNAAAAEYSAANDQRAIVKLHMSADREWAAQMERERAARLAS